MTTGYMILKSVMLLKDRIIFYQNRVLVLDKTDTYIVKMENLVDGKID